MTVAATSPILKINNLTISYRQGKQWLDAVRDVNLTIESGQIYGLVGESGSGKSTLALAIMRYLSENGLVRQGTIELAGQNLLALSLNDMRDVWRDQIKMVPQNPLSSLNPSLRIGEQVAEALPLSFSGRTAQAKVLDLLNMVHLADPERVIHSYPHQLSGGMQQRVMIAMALSGEPALLVLDEPTTNLDVTTEAVILDLLEELIRERQTAVLFVSHNLNLVSRFCNRVAVLYAGELVEDAAVEDLYRQPLHPYTRGLLDSIPQAGQNKQQIQLAPIPGSIPQLNDLPHGCVFTPRCPLAIELCARERPSLDYPVEGHQARCHRWPEILTGAVSAKQPTQLLNLIEEAEPSTEIVLHVEDVKKSFFLRRSLPEILSGQKPRELKAVDGISLETRQGQTLGMVGESGSGKSTLARCIIGLVERSSGEVSLLDLPLARDLSQRDRKVLRRIQMVFQNPEEALNPYRTIGDTLHRTLTYLAGYSQAEADEGVRKLLTAVKLSPSYAERLPSQLSGGEKQRVAIARAFASQPDLLVFDEAVSALDVSVQASILNLLNELQREHQSAYLFISHDLAVVSYLADQIAVVYLGHLMEMGRTQDVLQPPYHPYTEALLSAIPLANANGKERIRLEGEVPSPINIPSGCRFHTRCPRFLGDICVTQEPPWRMAGHGHQIYCHIPLDELKQMQRKMLKIAEAKEE
jgi:peptide/nickel transport system ATP-binding protein